MDQPIQLLLADDDIDDCELFRDVLDEIPMTTSLTTVNDGERLMQLLEKRKEALPDLLFLDLNMPRKNGFECLSEIKKDKQLKELPVIIFSTSYDKEIVKQLHTNGARFYIRKPNEYHKLKKIIQTAVSKAIDHAPADTSLDDFVLLP